MASNRTLVAKFAAHIAHLLNTGSAVVDVQPFALYSKILRTLASDRYRDGLLGHHILAPGTSVEEAAQKYFELVLECPLHLARDLKTHKGHELFVALCRRGLDGEAWASARLERSKSVPAVGDTPPQLRDVANRLATLNHSIADGNPARTTRAKFGPLYLNVEGGMVEVPEELSVWGAIRCAPLTLKPLAEGYDFNEFCSKVIQAIETANAHYGTLVTLGLSPPDWRDLPINTAKKACAFIAEVRALANASGSDAGSLDLWQQVWDRRQVPGYDSETQFWRSELGGALRGVDRPIQVDISLEEIADESGDRGEVLRPEQFENFLQAALDDGALSEFDAWILRQHYGGASNAKLARSSEARRHLGKGRPVSIADFEAYVDDLRQRTEAYARKRENAENPTQSSR